MKSYILLAGISGIAFGAGVMLGHTTDKPAAVEPAQKIVPVNGHAQVKRERAKDVAMNDKTRADK